MENETKKTEPCITGPAVYVGTYGKYSNGNLGGAWVDLEDYAGDPEGFALACRELHADEADPEIMYQDHSDVPDGMIQESSIDPELWTWLELDDNDRELLAVARDNADESITIEQAREAFMGRYESELHWAEEHVRDTGLLDGRDKTVTQYFDYKSFARDCGIDSVHFVRHGGEVWVFSRNY